MKKLLITSVLLCALGAMAPAADSERSFQTDRNRAVSERLIRVNPPSSDRFVGKRLTYSGILIQAIKADNPLQLINPAAPAKYGAGENNVVRDPKSGSVTGFKILAIEF